MVSSAAEFFELVEGAAAAGVGAGAAEAGRVVGVVLLAAANQLDAGERLVVAANNSRAGRELDVHGVRRRREAHPIETVAAIEQVVTAEAPGQQIVAITTEQLVVPRVAAQDVVAGATDHVDDAGGQRFGSAWISGPVALSAARSTSRPGWSRNSRQ